MGNRFYFFTEPDKLDTQVAAQAFGPAAPDPLTPGNDRYRITDTHPLTGGSADAVAVCDGILCAQQDGPNTLSLILRPSQAPPFESPVVSYFIYKGIDRGSLLNASGNEILDDSAASATDFIKKVATEWKKQNLNLSGSRAALGLDRDANFSHDDVNQTKIFTDADPIDRLFTYPHKTMQLPTVAAGDIIGSFKGSAGFEIVLQRLGYAPKLALARQAENYISVPSIAADNGGTPWQADDAAFFAHWHAKEQVLAYMDPCAYFGAFVQAALSKKSAGNADKIKGSDIYQDILKKFFNCNIAYLDIRNNYSYSYNLFGLYDDTIRFVSHGNANQTNNRNFRSGAWPLLRLAIADVPGAKKKSLYRTKLRLPVGKSSAPVVLVSKGFVTTLGPERADFRTPTIAPDIADAAFFTPIRLAFPATTEASQPVFTASYTRINLYEKIHGDPQPAAALNFAAKEFLDGVFRLRDLRLDTDYAGNALRFAIYPEDVLVDLDARFGPTYAASVGIAEDSGQITLFAVPSFFLPNTSARDRRPLSGWADIASGDTTSFLDKLSKTFPYTDITRKTITPGSSGDIDTLIVRHEPSINFNPVTDDNSIEDYCLLVLLKSDYNALIAQIAADAGSNTTLPSFLVVSTSKPKKDPAHDNQAYVELSLQNIGFSVSGAKALQHATPLAHKVYEYANS